jgi:hypothetical protein
MMRESLTIGDRGHTLQSQRERAKKLKRVTVGHHWSVRVGEPCATEPGVLTVGTEVESNILSATNSRCCNDEDTEAEAIIKGWLVSRKIGEPQESDENLTGVNRNVSETRGQYPIPVSTSLAASPSFTKSWGPRIVVISMTSVLLFYSQNWKERWKNQNRG